MEALLTLYTIIFYTAHSLQLLLCHRAVSAYLSYTDYAEYHAVCVRLFAAIIFPDPRRLIPALPTFSHTSTTMDALSNLSKALSLLTLAKA